MDVLKKQAIGLFAYGFTAWCGGGALAYFLTKRDLQRKYEKLADEEIRHAKEFYAKKYKSGEYEDPVKLAEGLAQDEQDLKDAVEDLQYGQQNSSAGDQEAAIRSIHGTVENKVEAVEGDVWDWSEEMEARETDPTKPYVITIDEYMQNEPEHTQTTLTYFAEDDVLADEKEHIPNSDEIVDDDNLNRFGHGSKDNNIVYVRNDRLEADYEILFNHGSYSKDVLGFTHSSDDRPGKSKLRRFRE